jgi:hypothetical protein
MRRGDSTGGGLAGPGTGIRPVMVGLSCRSLVPGGPCRDSFGTGGVVEWTRECRCDTARSSEQLEARRGAPLRAAPGGRSWRSHPREKRGGHGGKAKGDADEEIRAALAQACRRKAWCTAGSAREGRRRSGGEAARTPGSVGPGPDQDQGGLGVGSEETLGATAEGRRRGRVGKTRGESGRGEEEKAYCAAWSATPSR